MARVNEFLKEFDRLAPCYEELLKDPFRDWFGGGDSRFFHGRKADLVREHFRRRSIDTSRLSFLDVGCGRGELLEMLRGDFGHVAGCDPSQRLLEAGAAAGIEKHVQSHPTTLPFESGRFDAATAVCVYHHVAPGLRSALTEEVRRVMKPGGTLAIIEHNPYNPITRRVVRRTPVDADAVLLRPVETRRLLRQAGFEILEQRYFLYFPRRVYRKAACLESLLRAMPLGGQYAVFARLE